MHLFKVLTFVLFLSFSAAPYAHAAKDTPKKILKDSLYKSLNKISKEKKYPLVMQNIQTRLNAPYSSRDDLNVIMFWLRDHYLYDNGDPKFGLSYIQFLESLARSMKQSDPEQSHQLKINSVIHFFVTEYFLHSDLAVCVDQTSGANTREQLDIMRENYQRAFMAMKPEDKEHAYKTIFSFIDERKDRHAQSDICKSGVVHMQKVLESGNYQEDLSTKNGDKYIDDNVPVDVVDSQTWQKRNNALYNTLQNNLLALQ